MDTIKETAVFICVFLFFALLTFGALFFAIEAIRCMYHLISSLPTNGVEIISLILAMLCGGACGSILFISDTE